jgi:Tol biopolymer transport system component
MRLVVALLAATLIGCGGKITLKPMWAACPREFIGDPVWSPDGTQLAYTVQPVGSTTMMLYILDITGSSSTLLASLPSRTQTVSWSPDGSRLLSDMTVGDMEYELFTLDLSGSKYPFAKHIPGIPDHEWSPDGEQIALAYSGFEEPMNDLLVLSQRGDTIWRLTEKHPDIFASIWSVGDVDWSPDGSRIAFGAHTINNALLGVASADGSEVEFYPSGDAYISGIQWSPDGHWIGFRINDAAGYYRGTSIMRPDGTDLSIITLEDTGNWHWLSDSSGIIFVAGNFEIVTLSLDGTSRLVVSSGPTGNVATGSPMLHQFSPDAAKIAYTFSGQYGAPDLYIMNVDGTNVQQLTDNPGNHKCFQWPF